MCAFGSDIIAKALNSKQNKVPKKIVKYLSKEIGKLCEEKERSLSDRKKVRVRARCV